MLLCGIAIAGHRGNRSASKNLPPLAHRLQPSMPSSSHAYAAEAVSLLCVALPLRTSKRKTTGIGFESLLAACHEGVEVDSSLVFLSCLSTIGWRRTRGEYERVASNGARYD